MVKRLLAVMTLMSFVVAKEKDDSNAVEIIPPAQGQQDQMAAEPSPDKNMQSVEEVKPSMENLGEIPLLAPEQEKTDKKKSKKTKRTNLVVKKHKRVYHGINKRKADKYTDDLNSTGMEQSCATCPTQACPSSTGSSEQTQSATE